MSEIDEMKKIEELQRRGLRADKIVINVFQGLMAVLVCGWLIIMLTGCDGYQPKCLLADTNEPCGIFRVIAR